MSCDLCSCQGNPWWVKVLAKGGVSNSLYQWCLEERVCVHDSTERLFMSFCFVLEMITQEIIVITDITSPFVWLSPLTSYLRLNPTFQGYAQQDSQVRRVSARLAASKMAGGWCWPGVFALCPGQHPWRAEKRKVWDFQPQKDSFLNACERDEYRQTTDDYSNLWCFIWWSWFMSLMWLWTCWLQLFPSLQHGTWDSPSVARNPQRGRKKLRTKALLRVPTVCTSATEGCAADSGRLCWWSGEVHHGEENGGCQHFLAASQFPFDKCCEAFLRIALSRVQALCSCDSNVAWCPFSTWVKRHGLQDMLPPSFWLEAPGISLLHWEKMLECIAKKKLELAQLVEGEHFSAARRGGNIRSDLRTKLPKQLVKDEFCHQKLSS